MQQFEEDEVLLWLLDVFPGVPLQIIAKSYVPAKRDPERAAEIISRDWGRTFPQ